VINLLRFLAGSSRWTLVASVLAGAAGGAAGVALIAVIQAELARDSAGSGGLAPAFVALCLASGLSRIASQVAMVRLGQGAVATLTRLVARRVLSLPLRGFEALDRSALLAVLTEDVGLIANALIGVPQLCINVPIVVACLAYVGWLAPAILGYGIIFAASAIWVYVAFSTRGVARLRQARAEQDALIGHLRTLIDGFRELKLHRGRRESFLEEGLEPASEAVRRLTSSGLAHFAVAGGWSQVMFFGFIGLALFAIPGVHAIDRSSLIAVVLVVLYLMTPLDVILNWLPVLGRARASLLRVEALIPALEREIVVELEDHARATRPAFESIELDGATFAYEDGFALGPVDLTLRRGELVVLAGGNGSGKTTLVKLISGLYAPDGGSVRLDHRGVDDGGREAYRQLFSTVFADGHLFPDLLGLDAPDLEARAVSGLERLGLDDEVSLVEGRFSTVDLSQGRRRRLALLGALLEDRPILILDEWAANQDPQFKRAFYRELLPEWKALGKTLLVISHDEAYFDVADRVIRLGDGHVDDSDDPTPLLASGRNQR
jgi:putative ATP-binding cassette transporter